MKSIRTCSAVGFLLAITLVPVISQTIPSTEAKNQLTERATVCGLAAGNRASSHVLPQFPHMAMYSVVEQKRQTGDADHFSRCLFAECDMYPTKVD
jgi:hypothetical protein